MGVNLNFSFYIKGMKNKKNKKNAFGYLSSAQIRHKDRPNQKRNEQEIDVKDRSKWTKKKTKCFYEIFILFISFVHI